MTGRRGDPRDTGERPVRIVAGEAVLLGDLALPRPAEGIVLFAHGSGSGRLSPRNRFVAESLRKAGLGTLLLDLLTEAEEDVDRRTMRLRFDIGLLAGRLAGATDWLLGQPEARDLGIGYFGASTGAAAALVAAARKPASIGAVVSRGGRPDLARDDLPDVKAPTLLIVGGLDSQVLELNRRALELLPGEKKLEIVPGASHLFEEPGTLEIVADKAGRWFRKHLSGARGS